MNMQCVNVPPQPDYLALAHPITLPRLAPSYGPACP